ncbi:ATP-binding protein [Amycolatopsis sp. GM8]|uniref:ATP-binding protein n=1 Tax=Amycolatopsis sp. GM8 TaxID=2896530 RepID=UPI001F38A14D|nr:ATP-binding protein [Amycolatopsis sp. GM8]
MTTNQEHEPDGELARVHYLPSRRGESAPAVSDAEVIEGEIVTDADYNARQRELAKARLALYRKDAVTVYRGVRTAVTHQHAKTVYRHVSYVAGGTAIVTKRVWESRTNARYERMIATFEASREWDRLEEWECRAEQARERRHKRRMDWLQAPGRLAKAAAVGIGTVTVLLLVLGFVLAIASRDAGLILAPISGVISVIKWTYWLVVGYFSFLVGGLSLLAVTYLHGVGRKAGKAPSWTVPLAPRGEVVNLTPSIVVAALRDLGIKPLRDAIKDDADSGARMLGMITPYGPGAQVEITLPPQVTVSQLMRVRERLAGNLDRKEHEVHIECSPDSERVFTLWVAHSGALDQAVPPSPMLAEDFGPVDIYRDRMPWGVGLKGDAIELNLLQQHLLLAGLSKQGKTAAARALLLWISLDPTSKIWLADLKGFGDWSMFDGLADTLIEGAGDENFIATCDMLEAAVAEMGRRYEKWRAMGRKGDIDRTSSQVGSGFEPLFVVIDEVQKIYTCATEHPEGGEIGGDGKKSRAARAAQALHDQARAVNIHFLEFAQNPTNRNLPVLVREGAMIRASLYVGTESIAKMALGEAPVDTGAAPHALRAGLDRGTVVLAPGESMDLPGGATHVTVRTHYISTEQGHDIADRAKALRTQARPVIQRDLLTDVRAVCEEHDQEAPRAADVARWLRGLDAAWKPYQDLTGEALAKQLDACGVKPGSKGGYALVRTERVRHALAERDVTDEDS